MKNWCFYFALGTLPYSAACYAYLDPGTASIFLQGIIAAIAGGFIALKLYWARFKAFITGKSKEQAPNVSEELNNKKTK